MNKFNLTLTISIIGLLGCGKKGPVNNLEYRHEMDSICTTYENENGRAFSVSLCRVFDEIEWDSIAVVLPYSSIGNVRSLDYCFNTSIVDSLKFVVNMEGRQGLLFFNGGCVSHYSIITGVPSFEFITGVETEMPVIRRADCVVTLNKIPTDNADRPNDYFFGP